MIVTADQAGRAIDYCVWVFASIVDGDPKVVVGKAHGTTRDEALRGKRKIRDFLRTDYDVADGFDLQAPTFNDVDAIRALGKFTR